jgi:hypothetical protein
MNDTTDVLMSQRTMKHFSVLHFLHVSEVCKRTFANCCCSTSGVPPKWERSIQPFRLYPSPALRTVEISCPATGDPKPSITWLKDGMSFDFRQSGKVSVLEICFVFQTTLRE